MILTHMMYYSMPCEQLFFLFTSEKNPSSSQCDEQKDNHQSDLLH